MFWDRLSITLHVPGNTFSFTKAKKTHTHTPFSTFKYRYRKLPVTLHVPGNTFSFTKAKKKYTKLFFPFFFSQKQKQKTKRNTKNKKQKRNFIPQSFILLYWLLTENILKKYIFFSLAYRLYYLEFIFIFLFIITISSIEYFPYSPSSPSFIEEKKEVWLLRILSLLPRNVPSCLHPFVEFYSCVSATIFRNHRSEAAAYNVFSDEWMRWFSQMA